jgi:hypothetical protein
MSATFECTKGDIPMSAEIAAARSQYEIPPGTFWDSNRTSGSFLGIQPPTQLRAGESAAVRYPAHSAEADGMKHVGLIVAQ